MDSPPAVLFTLPGLILDLALFTCELIGLFYLQPWCKGLIIKKAFLFAAVDILLIIRTKHHIHICSCGKTHGKTVGLSGIVQALFVTAVDALGITQNTLVIAEHFEIQLSRKITNIICESG